MFFFFFFQAEDGIRDYKVTGVQTCALPISRELRRMMRTQILFQKEGEEEAGVFGTKYYPPKTDGNFWRGRRILNDMPFDEALAIWKETAQ